MAALSTDGLRSRRKFGVFDAPFEGDFVDLGNEKSKLRELGYIGKLRAIWARHGTWLAPALLTLVSLWTHLYRIGEAKFVVWDEGVYLIVTHHGALGAGLLHQQAPWDQLPPSVAEFIHLTAYRPYSPLRQVSKLLQVKCLVSSVGNCPD